jgi:putative RecB family exonuclease
MDIEELRKQPHLSFSAINEYLMCGLKYWFSRIEKISPEFIPDNLIFGKCVHQVLEEYNNCRLIGETPPLPTLISIFETCWDKAVELGIIDLIEEDDAGTVIITDYKTSSRSFSQSEVDSNLQLTLYQLAMEQNGYSSRDMLLKLDCLIKTQTPKHEQYYTVRAKEDIQRLLKIIQLVLKGISNEVFLPTSTSWMCTNCPYKSYCDQWLMENSYETQ